MVQVQQLEESTAGLAHQTEAAQAQARAAQLEAQAQQQSKDALERQLAAVEGKALRQQQGKVDAAQQRAEQFEVSRCLSQVPWGDKLLQSSSTVSRAVQVRGPCCDSGIGLHSPASHQTCHWLALICSIH